MASLSYSYTRILETLSDRFLLPCRNSVQQWPLCVCRMETSSTYDLSLDLSVSARAGELVQTNISSCHVNMPETQSLTKDTWIYLIKAKNIRLPSYRFLSTTAAVATVIPESRRFEVECC